MNLSPNILAKLDQPEQILDLDLDWQLVKQWEQEAFTHFPDLRAFSKLEGLSLSSHQISKLHKSFFPTSLERLDLSYNLLEHCKDFGFLPNLKSLDLSFNEVYDPKGLENLNTLEVLHLSHNQVENIRALDSLSRLRTLGLSGNRRIQDWKSISRLTSLKILYVKQLYGMTWDILEHLSDLEELYISFRRADKIPSFFTLKQLHWDLKFIGQHLEIPAFPSLTQLSLIKGPQLRNIKGLERQKKLEVLNLSHNYLEEIPDLSLLIKLKKLKLRNNPLKNFERVYELKQLEELDVRDTLLDRKSYRELVEMLPHTHILY